LFARDVALLCKTLPRSISNREFVTQLIRSSSSVGANYIEAREALGQKDLKMHLRISRKEAKESEYFLRLLHDTNPESFKVELTKLRTEAHELRLILSKIGSSGILVG